MASQTVIMLDVGPSMSAQPDDGGPRKLDLAVRAITLYIHHILDGTIGKVRTTTELQLACVELSFHLMIGEWDLAHSNTHLCHHRTTELSLHT